MAAALSVVWQGYELRDDQHAKERTGRCCLYAPHVKAKEEFEARPELLSGLIAKSHVNPVHDFKLIYCTYAFWA